jgi:hypothetical protein
MPVWQFFGKNRFRCILFLSNIRFTRRNALMPVSGKNAKKCRREDLNHSLSVDAFDRRQCIQKSAARKTPRWKRP